MNPVPSEQRVRPSGTRTGESMSWTPEDSVAGKLTPWTTQISPDLCKALVSTVASGTRRSSQHEDQVVGRLRGSVTKDDFTRHFWLQQVSF